MHIYILCDLLGPQQVSNGDILECPVGEKSPDYQWALPLPELLLSDENRVREVCVDVGLNWRALCDLHRTRPDNTSLLVLGEVFCRVPWAVFRLIDSSAVAGFVDFDVHLKNKVEQT